MNTLFKTVGIVGAGAMGRGIAQLAAQTGAQVLLFDLNAQAAKDAQKSIESQWQKLLDKAKITDEQFKQYCASLRPVSELQALEGCDLIVEAVVEILKVKQDLFTQLEGLVRPTCVLTSNTSSLSITSIAKVLQHPERFAGFHFFNPVPLMKVVEVVRALKSSSEVLQSLCEFTKSFGHTPIIAEDTPGFVVNHAGRAYGTEALRVVSEGVSDFATIDRILKDQVGFKLGPIELFDLTALDVSHPVMESTTTNTTKSPGTAPTTSPHSDWLRVWWVKKWAKAFTNTRMACVTCPRSPHSPPPAPLHLRHCPPFGSRPERPDVPPCTSCSKIWA